ncbi:MAG: FAD-dependent oxidoreductase [Planctomycetes bacterium]|nr:FAD-dependent oxidoreductase [Planctomycetota bacterium]MCW8134369.1 FAD-dependent oxidoreductase [Planctomycetota bacterium]
MPAAKIVMFTDGVSESNRLAKEVLEAHHLSWTERNINKDAEANAFIRKLCGAAVSPVLYVNDEWYPDPTQEEIVEACGVRFDLERLESRGQTIFDVIVVGLGPAGLAACHGCRLGGLSVLGLDENEPGGHLLNLTDVDEYLGVGFDEAVPGSDIAANFSEHARHVGAVLMRGKVNSIRIQGAFKRVHSSSGNYWGRAVIIATGAAQRELKIDGVERFLNRGIRYGAQVDAQIYAGRRVCVIGGGDEAMHAAIFLSHHAKFVTVLCPDDEPTGEPLLVERAKTNKVRIIPGAKVVAVKGDDALDNVFFVEKGIPEEQGLPTDAMVVALGPAPKQPIPGLERMPQDNGYFAHGEGGKTMFGGIYVAGDCTNIETRTLMSVVASGSLCAKRLWQWLASHPLPKLK